LCQIALHGFTPVVSASAWEFRRFGPFDLRVEWQDGRVDVSSMEGRLGASEGDDGASQVGRGSHRRFLSWSGAPDWKQNYDNRREYQEPVHTFHDVK
jgi:hypothetical protein